MPGAPAHGTCASLRGAAQASITCLNCVSRVTWNAPRLRVLRRLRDTLRCAGKITVRGLGDHHKIGSPALYQGKMPLR